ncbi:MAG: hypothetical protein NVV74_10370 [Magnetospirillum sp.]|nr:hypothetical protein [Magnetospirillum sp.]
MDWLNLGLQKAPFYRPECGAAWFRLTAGKCVAVSPDMVVQSLEKLLILQARDSKRLNFEQQLQQSPREIAAVEARIAAEKGAIEAAKSEWHTLESRKKALDGEIKAAEEKVSKYRTQQSQVRKNDEYQALTHEIEGTLAVIEKLEEDEIAVLFQIDEAKKRFSETEAELKKNISGYDEKNPHLAGAGAAFARKPQGSRSERCGSPARGSGQSDPGLRSDRAAAGGIRCASP